MSAEVEILAAELHRARCDISPCWGPTERDRDHAREILDRMNEQEGTSS